MVSFGAKPDEFEAPPFTAADVGRPSEVAFFRLRILESRLRRPRPILSTGVFSADQPTVPTRSSGFHLSVLWSSKWNL